MIPTINFVHTHIKTHNYSSVYQHYFRIILCIIFNTNSVQYMKSNDSKSMTSWCNTRSKFINHGISIPVDLRMGRPSPLPLPSLAMAPPFPTHTPVYGDKWLLSVLGKSTHKIESLGFNGRWINIFNVWNAIWSICKWDVHNMICWQIQSNMQ